MNASLYISIWQLSLWNSFPTKKFGGSIGRVLQRFRALSGWLGPQHGTVNDAYADLYYRLPLRVDVFLRHSVKLLVMHKNHEWTVDYKLRMNKLVKEENYSIWTLFYFLHSEALQQPKQTHLQVKSLTRAEKPTTAMLNNHTLRTTMPSAILIHVRRNHCFGSQTYPKQITKSKQISLRFNIRNYIGVSQ